MSRKITKQGSWKRIQERLLEVESGTIPYRIRRSRQAKNLLIHVDLDGKVEAVVPWHASYREAERFVQDRQGWIEEQLEKQAARRAQRQQRTVQDGDTLSFFGEQILVKVRLDPVLRRGRMWKDGNALQVVSPNELEVQRLVEMWCQQMSQEVFETEVQKMVNVLEVPMPKVRVSKAKQQWGSYSQKTRTVRLHWKLALVPLPAARYVIAHEAAHILHSNHSADFWALVARLDPEYRDNRRWLRKNGHTVGF